MKAFVLVRGDSGMMHLYDREIWKLVQRRIRNQFEFVTDNDDREILEGYQKLANEDIEAGANKC